MKRIVLWVFATTLIGCKSKEAHPPTAQQIVDRAIAVSGGELYASSEVSFFFRKREYRAAMANGKKVLERITTTDSLKITDVKKHDSFQRFFNDSLVHISDSLAKRYGNSVNSVHYFARLPYGLNDPAVNKKLLGEVVLKNQPYYKVEVTFGEENGGDDFEDVYLYWFHKESFKPDYLAYEFHVDGGGMRFREAYNERYVNGIRFVDYHNLKPKQKEMPIVLIDSLFEAGGLEFLSKIELENIQVERAD